MHPTLPYILRRSILRQFFFSISLRISFITSLPPTGSSSNPFIASYSPQLFTTLLYSLFITSTSHLISVPFYNRDIRFPSHYYTSTIFSLFSFLLFSLPLLFIILIRLFVSERTPPLLPSPPPLRFLSLPIPENIPFVSSS